MEGGRGGGWMDIHERDQKNKKETRYGVKALAAGILGYHRILYTRLQMSLDFNLETQRAK